MINARPVLPEFEYIQPQTIKEAVNFLKKNPKDAHPFMGGTDCFIAVRDGRLTPQYLVDLKHLEGFDALTFDKKKGLIVGAAVNLNRLVASKQVHDYYPLIAAAAREVGSYQLRTRATLAGNLCNASPCGDTIAPCLVYDASINIIGPDGERSVKLIDFFTGPGTTVLESGEIVKAINLPLPPPNTQGVYRSIGRNALGDLAIAAVTVLAFPYKSAPSGYQFRIALSAVAPTVIFAEEAQLLLQSNPVYEQAMEQAAVLAAKACKPIDDIRASARYRREMIQTLTLQALTEVWLALKEKTSKGASHGK